MTDRQFNQELNRLIKDAARRAKKAAKTKKSISPKPKTDLRNLKGIRYCIVREHRRRIAKR